jgi:hypothetical protein
MGRINEERKKRREQPLREGYETYHGYLIGYEEAISHGREIILEIRDLSRLERKIVRAIIAQPPTSLADGQKLWIRGNNERYLSSPWSIKIMEELDPDEIEPLRKDIDLAQWIKDIREEVLIRGGKNFVHYRSDGLGSSYYIG